MLPTQDDLDDILSFLENRGLKLKTLSEKIKDVSQSDISNARKGKNVKKLHLIYFEVVKMYSEDLTDYAGEIIKMNDYKYKGSDSRTLDMQNEIIGIRQDTSTLIELVSNLIEITKKSSVSQTIPSLRRIVEVNGERYVKE